MRVQLAQVLEKLPTELYGKHAQRQSARQIHPAEKRGRDKLASPCDQACHQKAPKDQAEKKCRKENDIMSRLRDAAHNCKDGCAYAEPKRDRERIAQ